MIFRELVDYLLGFIGDVGFGGVFKNLVFIFVGVEFIFLIVVD